MRDKEAAFAAGSVAVGRHAAQPSKRDRRTTAQMGLPDAIRCLATSLCAEDWYGEGGSEADRAATRRHQEACPAEYAGGKHALSYRRLPTYAAGLSKDELPASFDGFRRELKQRTFKQNARCLKELSRCAAGRDDVYKAKYALLTDISNPKNEHAHKYSSWLPTATELQRSIQAMAVSKAVAERSERRKQFLATAQAFVDEYYPRVGDCHVLVKKLEVMFAADAGAALEPHHFTRLVSSFAAARLLQDGLLNILDLIRPLFGVGEETWKLALHDKFRALEPTNVSLALDRHLVCLRSASAPSKSPPLRLLVRVHTVKVALDKNPATCQTMVVIRAHSGSAEDAVASTPACTPLRKKGDKDRENDTIDDPRVEHKTSVKRSNKPVWNEDFVVTLLNEEAVLELLLYDLADVKAPPVGIGCFDLDVHGRHLVRRQRTKHAVVLTCVKDAAGCGQEASDEDPSIVPASALSLSLLPQSSVVQPAEDELLISIEPLNFGADAPGTRMAFSSTMRFPLSKQLSTFPLTR
eukprot:gene13376-20594_t